MTIISLIQLQALCLTLMLPLQRCASLSVVEVTESNRLRLASCLKSASGKLTFSPELFIPEATTPTAILLQSTAITQLSERVRVEAKSNAAFISAGSLSSIKKFCDEQNDAMGNFPGPVPVVYCPQRAFKINKEGKDDGNFELDLSEIASTGVSGVLVPINGGSEISSLDEEALCNDGNWLGICSKSLDCGLQPIPEVTVSDSVAATWKDKEMESLVETIASLTGGKDPVSILLTINSKQTSDDGGFDGDLGSGKSALIKKMPLPVISKSLGKRIPIIASVRTPAGENRLGEEMSRLKSSGFVGAMLRRECVPSYPNNPSLEYLSDFWAACISDLKSTRSKSFNFRSKNNLEKSVATQWANYRSDVIASGALGDPDEPPPDFDPSSGDYQGF